MKIATSFKFDAAHRLYNYSGLCRNIHGHTWKVRVVVDGVVDNASGMVVDFQVLKAKVNEIVQQFDHSLILGIRDPYLQRLKGYFPEQKITVLQNIPTAENLALYIKERVVSLLNSEFGEALEVCEVVVYESEECWAKI